MLSKERLIVILNALTVFFLLLAVLLRPLVCGLSGGLATNILVTLPIVAALFLYVMGMVLRQEIRLRTTPMDVPIAALIFFALVSVGVAAYKHAAASIAFDWLCYVAVFYLVVNVCAENPRLTASVLAAAGASAFVVGLNGLVQHFYTLDLTRDLFLKNQESWMVSLGLPLDAAYFFVGRLATGRVFSSFLLPNTCAGFLGVMIPLQATILFWAVRASPQFEHKAERVLTLAVAAVCLIVNLLCLYYTKSKGGWISFTLVLAVWVTIGWRSILLRYAKWLAGAVMGIALLLATLQLTGHIPPFAEYVESLSVRTEYWRAGALIIRDHPWFGVGLGNFGEFYPQYRRPGDDETQMAHNNFVQIWAETGLFGFFAFCAVWAAFFGALRRGRWPGVSTSQLSSPSSEQSFDPRLTGGLVCLVGFAMIYTIFHSFEPLPTWVPWLLTACFASCWAVCYIATERLIVKINVTGGDFSSLGLCIRLGILFFLIHSLVDFDLYEQGVAQTVWLLAGVAMAPIAASRRMLCFRLNSMWQLTVGLPTVLVTAMLLCWVYPRFLEAQAHRENARDFMALREEQKALSEWLACARCDPWDAETQMALAEIFRAQWSKGIKAYEGRSTLELALSHARRAIELNPRRARPHQFLGTLYLAMSKGELSPERAEALRQAAVAEFEQAHRLFPSRATYAADLAFAYESVGRHAEALALFELALDLDRLSLPERFTAKLSPETRHHIERRLSEAQKAKRKTP